MIKLKKMDEQSPYSYLLINSALRNILLMLVLFCAVVLAAFLFVEISKASEMNIGLMVFYTSIICPILVFYPMTESWVYKPWQKAPQKLEQHEGK